VVPARYWPIKHRLMEDTEATLGGNDAAWH
jgi:hypothetical protein